MTPSKRARRSRPYTSQDELVADIPRHYEPAEGSESEIEQAIQNSFGKPKRIK